MPIDVFTGQPGNGKTSFMMRRLLKDAAKAERPIVAAGIDGLEPGLAMVLDDPRKWNDKDADGNYLVPDGSIIYVDEAWKWFGHLQDASRQATPPHVVALAEHRHRGLDFVWTTQMPNQLYPFVRGLIGAHTHCVRRFATQFVDLFTWGELQEDVKSAAKRELAQRETSTFPKEVRTKYKSATIHTVKARLPWKLYLLPVVAVIVVVCAIVVRQRLRPEVVAASAAGAGQPAGSPAGGPSGPGAARMMFATPADYVAAMTPRIEHLPASAPIYDGRAVRQYPETYCVIAGPGRDANGDWNEGGCTCYTQQMTRIKMHPDACRTIATTRGDFDPYREPPREPQQADRSDRGAGGTPAADGAGSAAPAVVGASAVEPVASYGGFRS